MPAATKAKKKAKAAKKSKPKAQAKAPDYISPDLAPLVRPIAGLVEDPANARTHAEKNIEAIKGSLTRFGQQKPIVATEAGVVVAGNGTLRAAKAMGWECLAVATFKGEASDAAAYGIADNRTGELAEWDDATLAKLLDGFPTDMRAAIGFEDADVDALLASLDPAPGLADPDDVPEPPEEPITQRGDLWLLGEHRLLCGDATSADDVGRVMDGETADLCLTDPPYCSGGFQEAGKAGGSVGTGSPHKPVARDNLSSRGYRALLKTALDRGRTPYVYAFTDWRMWVYLFDLVESEGYSVRSMIVWNKTSPCMGRGWRSQHELVLWACRDTPPFDKHAPAVGNVIEANRTGNKNHTTEKPVEVVAALLGNTPFAKLVYDPFLGSGTTLIACEQLNRRCRGLEIEPRYCDVIVKRWEQFTGKTAEREAK